MPSSLQKQKHEQDGEEQEQRVISIENVEFLKNAGRAAGAALGNGTRHRHRRSESFGSYNSDYSDANAKNNNNNYSQKQRQGTANNNNGSSSRYGSSTLGRQMQQQQQQQPPPSMTAAQAAAAAASSAAYEYQQQQAYYTHQFYYQQQQQAQPYGAYGGLPWPAPQPFYGMQQQQQQQQQAPYRRTNSQENATTTCSISGKTAPPPIQATMSNGSEQDDEYVALLQRNLSQVGGQQSGTFAGSNTNTIGGYGATGTSARPEQQQQKQQEPQQVSPPPPKTKPSLKVRPKHRRVQSEGMFKPQHQNQTLKKTHSKEKPPINSTPRVVPKTIKKSRHGRSLSSGAGLPSRTHSTSSLQPGPQRPNHHRRSTSNVSVASSMAGSVASEASFMSITTDIRKSTFYGGVDRRSGRVQLHYPNEQIYICVQDDQGVGVEQAGLTLGKVYAVAHDPEDFEEYHRLAEDAMWDDDDRMLDLEHNGTLRTCGCKCPVCTSSGTSSSAAHHKDGCVGHDGNLRRKNNKRDALFGALPVNKYALAVDPTVYRRVLDEISQAQHMPCGLFFCGHHEDVAHPSIQIAVILVVLLFASMAFVAFCLQV